MNAASVKDRLKKRAEENGKSMQELLVAYGLERTVYRLAISEYAERFTLKGGVFLYALFDGEYARATRDIDLLAKDLSNDTTVMKTVFTHIFSISCEDAIRYDLDSLEVKSITEFKEYHGVNVSIMAYLDRTRIPISIDVGYGDIVYPERIKIRFPAQLDMESPEVYAYSIPSAIAEKFEAIVSLGDANSRYKDYYDIWFMARQYDFDGKELKEAIVETFGHRRTGFDDILAFNDSFSENEIHKSRWNAFVRKKKALLNVEFNQAIMVIKELLEPIVDSIVSQKEYTFRWSHEEQRWK